MEASIKQQDLERKRHLGKKVKERTRNYRFEFLFWRTYHI